MCRSLQRVSVTTANMSDWPNTVTVLSYLPPQIIHLRLAVLVDGVNRSEPEGLLNAAQWFGWERLDKALLQCKALQVFAIEATIGGLPVKIPLTGDIQDAIRRKLGPRLRSVARFS